MNRYYPMPLELVGNVYGRLTVVDVVRRNGFYLVCRCECGTTKEFQKSNVVNGYSKSCGCYHKEITTKHGMNKTRFYKIWLYMRDRCNNVNSTHYSYYGGRGISVCSEWNDDFLKFKADMYESYLLHAEKHGESDTTLDRIDVGGNYGIDNCRWATRAIQAVNRGETPIGESGVRGVYYIASTGRWKAKGRLFNEEIRLGHYDTKEEAERARKKFEIEKGKIYDELY